MVGGSAAIGAAAVTGGAVTLGTGMAGVGLAGGAASIARQQITTGKVNYGQVAYEGIATALTFGTFTMISQYMSGAYSSSLQPSGNNYQTLSKEDYDYIYGNKQSQLSSAADQVDDNLDDLVSSRELTLSNNAYKNLKTDIQANGIKEIVKYVEYNGKKYIVDGHHRVAAAKELGITVPVEEVTLPYKGYNTVDDLFNWRCGTNGNLAIRFLFRKSKKRNNK